MLNLDNVKNLASRIKRKGGRAFLVGGFVRDRLMGSESKDYDLEVFSLTPADLFTELQMFANDVGEKLNLVGQSFQVFKIGLNLDVSIPRTDRKVGEGHKGFEITGDPNLSTFEASRRRDFTMNAMLLDPLTDEIIDHFGGRDDIKFGIINVVDPKTFVEDSLRALRAIQFASRFSFVLSQEAKDIIKGMDLRDLPRERVWMEFEKWLMLSPKPSEGLFLMRELGILERLFPELDKLVGVPQDVRYHPEGDVFVHTALALDVAQTVLQGLPYPEQVTVMLATLCHDLGKVETTEVFYEHFGGKKCWEQCDNGIDQDFKNPCV
jgi:tRNA nucleotidyltransferase (CCA-adding enzyme)